VVVADADVFAAFAGEPDALRGAAVLTPHAGEFARVFGRPSHDRLSAARAAATSKKKKRKPPRRLWGRDSKGNFRTRGGNSVATVRGTAWFVEDRCDGTLTRVSKGSVSVYDRGRHRTVLVRAGHSYLARAIR